MLRHTTRSIIVFSLAILLVAGCSKPPIMGKKLPVSNAELGELIAAASAGQIPIEDIEGNISSLEDERTNQAASLPSDSAEECPAQKVVTDQCKEADHHGHEGGKAHVVVTYVRHLMRKNTL